MAEMEMIAHIKKAVKVMGSKQKSWVHKAKEIFLEIFIVVFAVSLSIWFHELSEHRHTKKEVKFFLNELYQDLEYDANVYQKSKEEYKLKASSFSHIANLPYNQLADAGVVEKCQSYLNASPALIPTQGRYEAFKYTNKISNIKDDILVGDILDLFEEDLVRLRVEINRYQNDEEPFANYISNHLKRSKGSNNLNVVFSTDESVNYAKRLTDVKQIVDAYDTCIAKIKKINLAIIKEIGPVNKN